MAEEEDVRGLCPPEYGLADNFPYGMRVLAVDDEPVALTLLEAVLRQCDYVVTTTNEAASALTILRENRNNFDLLITDVVMPGMDGFKLLELVGQEMDLPVILFSAYNDNKRAMKAILEGACDYMSKPPRFDVLKNIWQHVVRKKILDSKHKQESPKQQFCAYIRISEDHVNSKGKEPVDDQEDTTEEDRQKNEESTIQKRRRVIWTDDLHKRFLEAVYQLGYEEAFPKRILQLMNVEGLTRENVASHLQKHRVHLKKIVRDQQINNMTVILRSKDSSYMQMSLLDGFSNLQFPSDSERFSTSALSSYPTGGHSETLEHVVFPTNPNVDLFEGVQSSLDPFDNTGFYSSSFGESSWQAPLNNARGEILQHQASSSANPQVASSYNTRVEIMQHQAISSSNPQIASSCNTRGEIMQHHASSFANPQVAISYNTRAVTMQHQANSSANPQVASSYNTRGEIMQHQASSSANSQVASNYNTRGGIMQHQASSSAIPEVAISYNTRGGIMQQAASSSANPQVAITYNTRGGIMQHQATSFAIPQVASSYNPGGEIMQHQATSSANPQVASSYGTVLLNPSRDHPSSSYIFQSLDGFIDDYYYP